MDKEEKLMLLEEIMDLESNSLTGDELLSDLDSWDSMSVLGFMTEMRMRYDITITLSQIRELKDVNDILKLIPD